MNPELRIGKIGLGQKYSLDKKQRRAYFYNSAILNTSILRLL